MAGSSGEASGAVPEYEVPELHTRVFHVGSFGALWKRSLHGPELAVQGAVAEDGAAAVAEELGCGLETAAELRAVCRCNKQIAKHSPVDSGTPSGQEVELTGERQPSTYCSEDTTSLSVPRCRQQCCGPPLGSSAAPAALSSMNRQLVGAAPERQIASRTLCIDMLKSPDDEEDPEIISEDSSLVTLRIRKKALERREETIIVDRTCRQETFTYEMESHAIGKRPKDPADLIEEGELFLTLNIFYPVIFQKHKDHKPYQTVLVLGSQKLTELRDSISCVSDLQMGGEFSSHPDQAPEHISKDLYKSAFFYFEGVFYNDRRHSECRDLSRTIIEWSESHDRGYGNLQSAKMEDYTFNDLSIKVGFPYLFCHQGDCEHIIIITDIRSLVCGKKG
ncbi:snRNA-activating protein complex subunit 3 [Chelonia mydas]|uniref:snRNA-activating protein complex subunit 3 n=1 Tax=Chelonia mydas TaxID=8469 RepID=M7BPY0_CHEMY|nr:snRNA-activating protein complex subunit 3 [Chelonia mydas]